MNSLTIDEWVQVLHNLPVQDIVNTCSTDLSMRNLCSNKLFWQKLIRYSFNREGSSAEEYKLYFEFAKYVQGKHLEIKEYLLSVEQYNIKDRISYCVENPSFFLHRGPTYIYTARTFAGALLKSKVIDELLDHIIERLIDEREADEDSSIILPKDVYNGLWSDYMSAEEIEDIMFIEIDKIRVE